MAIVAVSRWQGSTENLGLAKQIAPVLKRHGAVSVQLATSYAGPFAGQIFGIIAFPDWATYGRAMQALTADPEYQRIYAQVTKSFTLQGRSLMVVEDL